MIIRAGYGQSTKDPKFEYNVTQCQKYGIPFAVYWYSYATSVARAEDEATFFYNYTSKYDPVFYSLDFEEGKLTGAMINAATRKLRELGAKKIVNYIANHRFKKYKCDTSLPDAIWIPKYGTSSQPTHRPCDLWQKKSSAVAGFKSKIDTNVIPASSRYKLEWFITKEE